MYLADVDIRRHLEDINFHCRYPDHPFDPAEQIGPASVDIRIDTVFWQAKRKSPRRWRGFSSDKRWRGKDIVDLRRHDVYEVQPTLHWTRKTLNPGDTIVLHPGDSIMARTYEEFSMPVGMAGKLAARVSYSRLGLLVHCGNDFMNPGWRGHHPLQLVNMSGLPIRIAPFFPVAQLSFVKLTQPSEQVYSPGERYMNDDGGPSKWWRDALVRRVVSAYGQDNLPPSISERINGVIAAGAFSDEQLARLLDFREATPVARFTDGTQFISEFAEREQSAKKQAQLVRGLKLGSSPVLIGAFIGSMFVAPVSPLHLAVGAATAVSVALGLHALFTRQDDDYFLPTKWQQYQALERGRD